MIDIETELNEKLKEVCEQLDIDSDDYIVIDKAQYEILCENSDELMMLHEFGVSEWENYDKAVEDLQTNYRDCLKEALCLECKRGYHNAKYEVIG